MAVERMVPGESGHRLQAQHVLRYVFAAQFALDRDVLDCACGAGYAAPIMWGAGAKSYLGVDVDRSAIEHAMATYKVSPTISFTTDDACELRSVPDHSVDLVVSFETIEHVPSPERMLDSMARILRRDGKLIVSTPNRIVVSPGNDLTTKPSNQFHVVEWNTREFLKLLSRRFRVTQVLGQNPLPSWRIHLLDASRRRRWLGSMLEMRSKLKHGSSGPALATDGNGASMNDFLPVRTAPAMTEPEFVVCVATPK